MKRTLDNNPSVAAVQVMLEAVLQPVEVWFDQLNKDIRIRKPSSKTPRQVGAYTIGVYDSRATLQEITDDITRTKAVLLNAISKDHKANKVKLNPDKRPSRFACGQRVAPI